MPEQPKYTYYASLPMTSIDVYIAEEMKIPLEETNYTSIFDKLTWRICDSRDRRLDCSSLAREKEREMLFRICFDCSHCIIAFRQSSENTLVRRATTTRHDAPPWAVYIKRPSWIARSGGVMSNLFRMSYRVRNEWFWDILGSICGTPQPTPPSTSQRWTFRVPSVRTSQLSTRIIRVRS